jgi:hypothetical protein
MPTPSRRYKDAELLLPEPLKPVFARLVLEYGFLTSISYGKGYVNYRVLAELVLAGWRPSAESDPHSKLNTVERKR